MSSPVGVGVCAFLVTGGVALIGRDDDLWTLMIGAALIGAGMGWYPLAIGRP